MVDLIPKKWVSLIYNPRGKTKPLNRQFRNLKLNRMCHLNRHELSIILSYAFYVFPRVLFIYAFC